PGIRDLRGLHGSVVRIRVAVAGELRPDHRQAPGRYPGAAVGGGRSARVRPGLAALEPPGPRDVPVDLLPHRVRVAVPRLPVRHRGPPVTPGTARQDGGHRCRERAEDRQGANMSRLTRADLDALPTYVPGRTVPGAIKPPNNPVPH